MLAQSHTYDIEYEKTVKTHRDLRSSPKLGTSTGARARARVFYIDLIQLGVTIQEYIYNPKKSIQSVFLNYPYNTIPHRRGRPTPQN